MMPPPSFFRYIFRSRGRGRPQERRHGADKLSVLNDGGREIYFAVVFSFYNDLVDFNEKLLYNFTDPPNFSFLSIITAGDGESL